MSHPEAILEVRHLNRIFRRSAGLLRRDDQMHAVRDLSMELRRGETLGIVGESGCGKSTLARMLVGLDTPSSGEIRLFGETMPAGSSAVARFVNIIERGTALTGSVYIDSCEAVLLNSYDGADVDGGCVRRLERELVGRRTLHDGLAQAHLLEQEEVAGDHLRAHPVEGLEAQDHPAFAQLRGVAFETLAEQTSRNFFTLFDRAAPAK